MLNPGVIPDKEPDIRVRIILPEDKQSSLSLEIPGIQSTSLVINNSGTLPLSDYKIEIAVNETYIEQKHVHFGFDVCNDDCCQRYQGVNNLTPQSKAGALNTRGQVLMFDNKICDARYSKSCGGVMEKFESIWENKPLPYMQNIPDAKENICVDLTKEPEMKKWVNSVPRTFCSPHYIPENKLKKYLGNVDEEGKYFRWTVETSQQELVDNINEKLKLNAKAVLSLIPLKRAGSGRMLELEIKYIDNDDDLRSYIIEKDYEVRRVLHKMFLYSSALIIEEINPGDQDYPEDFIFKGAGWGHGAGLCQIGALGMMIPGMNQWSDTGISGLSAFLYLCDNMHNPEFRSPVVH